MLTKEELEWIQKYSDGFDDGKQLWKEWQSRPLSFWMCVVRENGGFFWKAPDIYQENHRFKVEASKGLGTLSYYFLKGASEELKLLGLMRSEFNNTWENQSPEFELLSCPSIQFRENAKKQYLNQKIISYWDRPKFGPLDPNRREIEYDFHVDSSGVEECHEFELLVLNDKSRWPEAVTTEEAMALIMEDPEFLFLLSNGNKNYRLSRYANRMNDKTKLASPYLALEFVEGELLKRKRTFD